MKSLKKVNVKGKRVLLRIDADVPIKHKVIADDRRLHEALPTIRYLLRQNCSIVIVGHLGRPAGEKKEYSLKPVAKQLSKLLRKKVIFLPSTVDEHAQHAKEHLKKKQILLLENLRFHKGEKENSVTFAKKLVKHCDVYVNEAFANSHRKHASMHAVTKYVPSYAGLALYHEIHTLRKIIRQPKKPFVAIIGGAKVSTKIAVLKNLVHRADAILIGGAMMFTFYKALGMNVGKSLVEDDQVKVAKKLLKTAKQKIILPVDVVVASSLKRTAKRKTVPVEKMPASYYGLDVGKETIKYFLSIIDNAKTVFWNGPLGMVEHAPYRVATRKIAKNIAKKTKKHDVTSVIGGGDTLAIIKRYKLDHGFSHISTGGGSLLTLIEKDTLPSLSTLS